MHGKTSPNICTSVERSIGVCRTNRADMHHTISHAYKSVLRPSCYDVHRARFCVAQRKEVSRRTRHRFNSTRLLELCFVTSSSFESQLTGLEYMQAVVAGKIPMPPMAETVPMRCTAASPGAVTFTARADARHLNRANNVHGGFTATVLDSVTSCALRTSLEAGVGFVTIELNVKLMKPVPRDTDLIAEGKLVNVSRRLGVAEARLFDDKKNLCAHGIATFMLSRPALRGDD
jgi:uncharacterized protein (TIGR00369 family)